MFEPKDKKEARAQQLLIKGVYSELDPQSKAVVDKKAEALREIFKTDRDEAMFATVMVTLEAYMDYLDGADSTVAAPSAPPSNTGNPTWH